MSTTLAGCADCAHATRYGNCGEPVAAGLAERFGLVRHPEDGRGCPAFTRRPSELEARAAGLLPPSLARGRVAWRSRRRASDRRYASSGPRPTRNEQENMMSMRKAETGGGQVEVLKDALGRAETAFMECRELFRAMHAGANDSDRMIVLSGIGMRIAEAAWDDAEGARIPKQAA